MIVYYNIWVHQISCGRLIHSCCESCFQEDDVWKNWCYKRCCEELMGANVSIFGRVLVAVAPTTSESSILLLQKIPILRPFFLAHGVGTTGHSRCLAAYRDTEPRSHAVAVCVSFSVDPQHGFRHRKVGFLFRQKSLTWGDGFPKSLLLDEQSIDFRSPCSWLHKGSTLMAMFCLNFLLIDTRDESWNSFQLYWYVFEDDCKHTLIWTFHIKWVWSGHHCDNNYGLIYTIRFFSTPGCQWKLYIFSGDS